MANTLAPSGFSDGRLYNAAAPNYATRTVQIAYNNSHSIGYGDPVALLSTGFIDVFANGGTTIHGIFVGCEYLLPALGRWNWYPAWTAATLPSTYKVHARVVVDPMATFRCQVNGGPLVQASIGLNYDITTSSAGAPNAQSGMSTCSIDFAAGGTTTATLPFRIVNLASMILPAGQNGTDNTSNNNQVVVTFNNQDFHAGVTGV